MADSMTADEATASAHSLPTGDETHRETNASGYRREQNADDSLRIPVRREMPPDRQHPGARSTKIARFLPPTIDRTVARIARAVCNAQLSAYLRSTTGITGLHTEVMNVRTFGAAFVDPAVIKLSIGATTGTAAASIHLALDLHDYPALAIAAWPEQDTSPGAPRTETTRVTDTVSADVALRQAVANVLLAPMLEQLARLGLNNPRVLSLHRGRPIDLRVLRLGDAPIVAVSFALDTRRFNFALLANSHCYNALDALLPAKPRVTTLTPTQPNLRIPGRVVVGIKSLKIDTLNTLDTGDVLLHCTFPTFNAAVLSNAVDTSSATRRLAIAVWGAPGLKRLWAAVELDGQSLVVVKEPTMSEELDETNTDAGLVTGHPEIPIDVGDLELPVQFEIDTVALSVAQLSSLGPGYVIELPIVATDAQLRLVAHGQTIGFGELVTVGEQLGIRILRMAHKHGPAQ